MADYSKMKVVELKAELKRLGLPQNGLKAELVSRLEEAAATEDDAAAIEPELSTEAMITEETIVEANDAPQSEDVEPTQAEQHEPATATTHDVPESDAQAQTVSSATTTEAPLTTTEVVQDVQKRKRRSTTPTPTDEVARKRLRQDSNDVPDAAPAPTLNPQDSSGPDREETRQEPTVNIDMEAVRYEDNTNEALERHENDSVIGGEPTNGVHETGDTHIGQDLNALPEVNNGHVDDAEDSPMVDAEVASNHGNTYPLVHDSLGQEIVDEPRRSPSPERDIEPSIHPATCALYIKNFMRPLRPQAVQQHLLELATPANALVDPNVVVDFYLDNIRTHAFAVFTSISAASRVRTALHKRVWPDETNRKALWIDFIPPESVKDWIDTEQEARNKGNMPRYEVSYDRDDDDNVLARLEESDGNQPARRGPVSPVLHPERKASIPTGPSRPSGIENAPTGPRNPYSHSGPAMAYPNRQDKLDSGFVETRCDPPVLYRPVAPEIARRRLACLAEAKNPYYNEESGRDYHRYYFEREDILVNRGPEIFLGIRPPHREKERRELERAGINPRDRSFRDRRGPSGPPMGIGGGGGRHRRRAPRPHGVPRGGDRFRPDSSFGGNRPNFDDRRDGYGRGGRRKNNYGRY